ncbi:putative transcriptional regulator YwtF [Anaerotignum neopropionicum]|uniref:Putative transcriptional regulator YwtF n=1 Tax=Anaerotignum neopropionicum TaxID=36847 RepID=A0A136WHM3_9FIRM|nr:LCP family protein [Anaerotignum neopropionicum]KXL53943.1 putative transcriptional regulator YwtF [Anaerotignum neopropionicum]
MDKKLWKLYFKTLLFTLVGLCGVLLVLYGIFMYMIEGVNRQTIDENSLSVNEELSMYANQGITNIALFGIDTEDGENKGRSDAIMIASVNGKTGKIKLISIARDTYVDVPERGKTKINHAYAYGGAALAIQTINENFDLNIKDYVTVNFDSLADVIEELGGIDLEVTAAERQQINNYLLKGEKLQETGMVHLTGPQAVSYSRIRKIDSDVMRGERQRKVLECLFQKALDINPLLYPSYVKKFAPMVETSLSNEEILKLASVGLKSGLTLEQAGLPNDNIDSYGQTISGVWYYVYDIDQAADMVESFIYHDIPFDQYGKEEGREPDTE